MKSNKNKIFDYFRKQGGIARFSPIRRSGFHSDFLKILEKEKRVEKIQ